MAGGPQCNHLLKTAAPRRSGHVAWGFLQPSLEKAPRHSPHSLFRNLLHPGVSSQGKSFPLVYMWVSPVATLTHSLSSFSITLLWTVWLYLLSDLPVGRRSLLWDAPKAFPSPSKSSPVPEAPLAGQVLWASTGLAPPHQPLLQVFLYNRSLQSCSH